MQTSLFGREDDRQNQELQLSPAEKWDMDAAKHSLDELFKVSSQYRSSDSYMRMMDFINQFPYIAPFNAMLAHIQMPGLSLFQRPEISHIYFFSHKFRLKKHRKSFTHQGTRPGTSCKPLRFHVTHGRIGDGANATLCII